MMPDVALVEFPPMKLKVGAEGHKSGRQGKEKRRDAPLLVEEENIGSTLEKSVCGGQAGKTTTDYDDLCHMMSIE